MKNLLVVLCLCLGLVPVCAQQILPNPKPWLRSGPMLGYSELTETVIWLQTIRSARVQIRFWKQGQPASSRMTSEIETTAAGDHIARFVISQLEFGTKYDYEVYLDGLRVDLLYQTTFQTQRMWKWRGDPPAVRIAMGSCAYINDPPYDRPGQEYGRKVQIFTSIAALHPDAMLWLGDNTYYREGDWATEGGMRYRYAHTRATAEMQPLLASTHNYAIWDDHDYGSNDGDRNFRGKAVSLQIFKDYWANQAYGTPETPGVFSRFEFSDIDFFFLDDRYYRAPNNFPEGPDQVMFGDAQMKWLMDGLTSSEATFKVIVGGNQMMNNPTQFESFSKYPQEMNGFFDFLRRAKIKGVLFISGDRHHTELIKRVEPGLYPLYDLTASPLTSGSGPHPGEENNPLRVPGTWVTEQQNFSVMEVTGTKDERVMTLRTLDTEGKELWKYTISAAELVFPPDPPQGHRNTKDKRTKN
ncbi:MAG: alkaline phosphatase family protein [Acidobacteria bacterium]|nr:alkaline phosphatase family protein [Acidobacteriota bacterium]